MIDALSKSDRAVAYRLLRRGPASQADLVASTGLSRPTVIGSLRSLSRAGLAEEASGQPEISASPGPRAKIYRLTPAAGVAVGVEIGRRHINMVVIDAGHKRIFEAEESVEAGADDDSAAVLGQCVDLVQRGIERECPDLRILGVAVGVPVPITAEGKVGSTTLLRAWANVDPARELRARLGPFPVHVGNEADLGALGEYMFGRGEGKRDLTYVKLGTGIGAGIIVNGHLHRGTSGIAGELGHMTIDYQGRECPCGNRGCLERYAGGPVLLDDARRYNPEVEDLPALVGRAQAGDVACKRIINRAGTLIGTAIGTLVNINGPGLIVLGGSLSAAGEILTHPLRTSLEYAALAPAVQAVSIETGHLKGWSSACGAAAYVFERFSSHP